MSFKKFFDDIGWFSFSKLQKLLIIIFFLFHISLLFSVSNRGNYGNIAFGFWRQYAWDTSGWIARAGDYYAVYEAGHQAILGRPIFRVQPEMNFLSKSESLMRVPYTATFRYPPLFAYTFCILLNILPPEPSYKAWILLNELLIFIGIFITAKIAVNKTTAFYTILAWLAFYPIHIEYYMGQFSLFMGFLLFFIGINLLNEKHDKAVLWWGLSIFLKVYSIFFVLYWIFAKKIKKPLIWIAVLILSSFFYFIIFPSDFKIFYERGIAGRLFSKSENITQQTEQKDESIISETSKSSPNLYWGSMGVQRGVLAITRLFYLKQDEKGIFKTPYWAHYFLFLTILFPFPFLFIAAKNKNRNPLVILTLFSLGWFFWYFDTWEHHYTLILPLLALLISQEIIKGKHALIIYFLLASPSLWFIFASPETNPLCPQNKIIYFILETIYYLIKPAGIIYLFFYLLKKRFETTA